MLSSLLRISLQHSFFCCCFIEVDAVMDGYIEEHGCIFLFLSSVFSCHLSQSPQCNVTYFGTNYTSAKDI